MKNIIKTLCILLGIKSVSACIPPETKIDESLLCMYGMPPNYEELENPEETDNSTEEAETDEIKH